eukprot:3319151-Ditylum_brightwellii.AAC.1
MKINNKSLKSATQNLGNKPLISPFYLPDSEKKLTPLEYQTYKLRTNPNYEKLMVYYLVVNYYKVGTPEETSRMEMQKGDALQVFEDKEESQEVKDGTLFTKCLAAATEHVFPKKAYIK